MVVWPGEAWTWIHYVVGLEEESNNPTTILEKPLNIPNPFNKNTTIFYSLTKKSNVSIKISDLSGRIIRETSEGIKQPGNYNYVWDRKDNNGSILPAGSYFYSIKIDDRIIGNKVMVID